MVTPTLTSYTGRYNKSTAAQAQEIIVYAMVEGSSQTLLWVMN